MLPVEIERDVQAILSSGISEEEARRRYPWVIEWFNSHVDLAELIRESGVDLRPLSPDSNVLVGRCPCCGRNCLAV